MKRLLITVLGLALTVSLFACTTSPLNVDVHDRNPWTHLKLNYEAENFQFVIVSDRTGGHRAGVFPDAMRRINLLQPEFVMCIGDLIEGKTKDIARVNAEWDEFTGFVEKLDMPFFYTVGNHDITNVQMIPVWQSRFGRSYYHFTYHNVLFVVLNTEDPPSRQFVHRRGNIGTQQLAWFKQVLAKHGDPRWTFVFMHKPIWRSESNWPEVARALGDRERLTVFGGHRHGYHKMALNGRDYYTLATTGGRLKGLPEESFDHVVWVTVTDDGPIIANLMLDGIWTDDPVGEANAKNETGSR